MARVTKAIARAVLWHALGKQAKKLTERSKPTDKPKPCDRDLLVDGSGVALDLVIAGKVGPFDLEEKLSGKLTVDHAGETTKSDTVPLTNLIAWLLARHGEDDAGHAVATLTEHYTEHGSLPDVSQTSVAAAEGLIASLTTKYQAPKRGAVKLAAKLVA